LALVDPFAHGRINERKLVGVESNVGRSDHGEPIRVRGWRPIRVQWQDEQGGDEQRHTRIHRVDPEFSDR
jgi:hypothetical protein